jgi:hypothetical protein
MVQHLAIYTTEAEPKQSFRNHDQDSARRVGRFDFLTTQAM